MTVYGCSCPVERLTPAGTVSLGLEGSAILLRNGRHCRFLWEKVPKSKRQEVHKNNMAAVGASYCNTGYAWPPYPHRTFEIVLKNLHNKALGYTPCFVLTHPTRWKHWRFCLQGH